MKNDYNLKSSNDGIILHKIIILQYYMHPKSHSNHNKYVKRNTKMKYKNDVNMSLYHNTFCLILSSTHHSKSLFCYFIAFWAPVSCSEKRRGIRIQNLTQIITNMWKNTKVKYKNNVNISLYHNTFCLTKECFKDGREKTELSQPWGPEQWRGGARRAIPRWCCELKAAARRAWWWLWLRVDEDGACLWVEAEGGARCGLVVSDGGCVVVNEGGAWWWCGGVDYDAEVWWLGAGGWEGLMVVAGGGVDGGSLMVVAL